MAGEKRFRRKPFHLSILPIIEEAERVELQHLIRPLLETTILPKGHIAIAKAFGVRSSELGLEGEWVTAFLYDLRKQAQSKAARKARNEDRRPF